MAANKYISLVSGKLKEVFGTQISSGVTDANKIPALDSSGKLDVSLLPTGVAPEVVIAPSSENLSAGDFVNFYNNLGIINVRKADATTNGKPAHGFVLNNVTSPANATVYLESSQNNSITGLTIGSDYFLSTTPGVVTTTAPNASGNIVQLLGRATSATNLPFTPGDTVEIA
jgi:hypothetical protein